MKSGEAATVRLRPIFVWGQRMIVAVEIWFCAGNCVSLLYGRQEQKKNGYEDDSGIYSTVEGI